jgi:polar amino acid transport system permease protein
VIAPHFDLDFFPKFVFPPSAALLGGLAITIYVTVAAQLMGVLLGVLSALAGMARNPILRSMNGAYIWFFRGTPVLVQIALLYYGTPYLLGVDLFPLEIPVAGIVLQGAILAGILALGVNEGAYMSEIVRAGIISVDPGQTEAAKSLGMTYRLTMSRIVLPQALRVIIPPLGNEFNNMLKTTSLLSVIAVEELFRNGSSLAAATFKPFEPLLGVSVYYLLLTTIWSTIQGRIERRLGAGTLRVEQPSLFTRLVGLRSPRRGGELGRWLTRRTSLKRSAASPALRPTPSWTPAMSRSGSASSMS